MHLDTRVAEPDELSVARETEFAFCDQSIDITYVHTREGSLVRKELWVHSTFCVPSLTQDTVNVPRALVKRLIETLCCAA
jgi:hypothetical protein